MYPPFSKIIRILFSSEDENLAKNQAKVYYEDVKKLQAENAGQFVYLGVMKSPIGRIQNKYRIQILMRIKPEKQQEIINQLFVFADKAKHKNVNIFVEIDPQNLS